MKARRRAWSGRELPLEPTRAGSSFATARTASPATAAGTRELLAAIARRDRDGADRHTSATCSVALTLNDVPIDVLAERLDTTRGALYKTLHDARRKLRAALEPSGPRPRREGSTP